MELRPLLDNPSFLRFYDHWLAIRNGRTVPLRSHIDPVEIGPELKFVWLYDYLDGERNYRCRLAGEHIQDAFKRRLSGLMVDQIYTPEIAATVMGYWDTIREMPAVVYGESVSPTENHTQVRSTRLMLPLADEAGMVRQIFGMTQYDFDTADHDLPETIDGSDLRVIPCAELGD